MRAGDVQTLVAQDSAARRKKSVTRAFRFDEDLDRSLWQEAERERISANALANKILKEYMESAKIKEQIDWVQIPTLFFLSLVESVPEDQLRGLGRAVGIEVFRQILLALCGKTDSTSFVKFLPTICGFMSSGLDSKLGIEEEAGQRTVVCYHHSGGSKLSKLLANFLSGAIEELAGEETYTECTKNSFSVRFRVRSTGGPAGEPS